jgi:hypothetical protein
MRVDSCHFLDLSVIICDLDSIYAPIAPNKTNAPLIVDPDAVLLATISFEGLKAIPGRSPQIA